MENDCHCLLSSSPDHGVIRSDRVFDAMLATDRGLYSIDYPYADSPQTIGFYFSCSSQTISCFCPTIRVLYVLCFMSTDMCCDFVL